MSIILYCFHPREFASMCPMSNNLLHLDEISNNPGLFLLSEQMAGPCLSPCFSASGFEKFSHLHTLALKKETFRIRLLRTMVIEIRVSLGFSMKSE